MIAETPTAMKALPRNPGEPRRISPMTPSNTVAYVVPSGTGIAGEAKCESHWHGSPLRTCSVSPGLAIRQSCRFLFLLRRGASKPEVIMLRHIPYFRSERFCRERVSDRMFCRLHSGRELDGKQSAGAGEVDVKAVVPRSRPRNAQITETRIALGRRNSRNYFRQDKDGRAQPTVRTAIESIWNSCAAELPFGEPTSG